MNHKVTNTYGSINLTRIILKKNGKRTDYTINCLDTIPKGSTIDAPKFVPLTKIKNKKKYPWHWILQQVPDVYYSNS